MLDADPIVGQQKKQMNHNNDSKEYMYIYIYVCIGCSRELDIESP